ncbi:MAG: AbrB family transcriptional regulator [Rhodocyclaceae bacterium]|nr:AbrB family transcriptional regulator [Rhodocyclaceae bacterium]MBX3670912.1 AbrB family transcriptional regulator [Rhodocyclaceae bacterium]
MRTRVFKSGNSFALRLPKDLALFQAAQEVEVERVGSTLVVRPVAADSLADMAEILAAFPAGFMAEGRGEQEQDERDWALPDRADFGRD